MAKKIILLTGNERKKKSFEKIINGRDIVVEIQNPWIPEIQAKDNSEVAKFSAKYGANLLNQPVVKMDSGFYIEALDGFPGPYVSYVDKQIGADLFFKILKDLENRKAYIKNSLAYCEPNSEAIAFESGCDGEIVSKIILPEGSFIDRLFIPRHPKNVNMQTMGEVRNSDYTLFLDFWGDAENQFIDWFLSQ